MLIMLTTTTAFVLFYYIYLIIVYKLPQWTCSGLTSTPSRSY